MTRSMHFGYYAQLFTILNFCCTLAANLMARTWNSATEHQTVTTIGAAKLTAWKWSHNLLVF